MANILTLIGVLLAPKGFVFWCVTIAAGSAAAIIFLINAGNRHSVDEALKMAAKGSSSIGMFDYCGASSGQTVDKSALVVPERSWCYDGHYLDQFRAIASAHKTEFGNTALQRYLRPTLVWNDVVFAVTLAIFTAMLAAGIAPHLPGQPWTGYVMLVMACSGLIYGIADVAEDWKLLTILEKGAPVDPVDATEANTLTRIKLVTIAVSIIGGAMFLLLTLIGNLLKRFAA
jgi:hypothetical protein